MPALEHPAQKQQKIFLLNIPIIKRRKPRPSQGEGPDPAISQQH